MQKHAIYLCTFKFKGAPKTLIALSVLGAGKTLVHRTTRYDVSLTNQRWLDQHNYLSKAHLVRVTTSMVIPCSASSITTCKTSWTISGVKSCSNRPAKELQGGHQRTNNCHALLFDRQKALMDKRPSSPTALLDASAWLKTSASSASARGTRVHVFKTSCWEQEVIALKNHTNACCGAFPLLTRNNTIVGFPMDIFKPMARKQRRLTATGRSHHDYLITIDGGEILSSTGFWLGDIVRS